MSSEALETNIGLERLLAGLPINSFISDLSDSKLKNLHELVGDVYEGSFGRSDTSKSGLSLEELAHDYRTIKDEMEGREIDFQPHKSLNELVSLSFDEKDIESDNGKADMERMELDRKMSLNREVNVYYLGDKSLWIEGVDGEKTAWLKVDSEKASGLLPQEPDIVIEDEYSGNSFSVSKLEDSYVLDYGGVKLAHLAGDTEDVDANIATISLDEGGVLERDYEDFYTVFFLTDSDVSGEAEGKEIKTPSEWICSLGVIDV